MNKLATLLLFSTLAGGVVHAQVFTRHTYHDTEKKNLKEVYQVKDTITNAPHGRYVSYFLNGNIESKGHFVNNETTGVWEFFYETGNMRMRGVLRQNSNYGLWEYYYENGQKSMEGMINEKMKEGRWKIYYESGKLKEEGDYIKNTKNGLWRTYYEDGALQGEIEYVNDHGRYIEYSHSGKVLSEGPRSGNLRTGFWRFYDHEGVLSGAGEYVNGKKNGDWKNYYPSGSVASAGRYENDLPVGTWTYFFENGAISSQGEFVGGQKNGYWSVLGQDGGLKSKTNYVMGSGEYREYYASGKLKVKGQIEKGKNQGKWDYYYEDGKKMGEADFDQGRGNYLGFYPGGSLQTKGVIEDDLWVGTWELYDKDGSLSGYYKPFYENNILANEINSLLNHQAPLPVTVSKQAKKGFYYFTERFPEYRSVIVQGNPLTTFIGWFPVAVEFYNQERLGHVFEFEGIRDPFFSADGEVAQNQIFKRGYAISVKQKFYNPVRTGMWYFGHELRLTNVSHFSNLSTLQGQPVQMTASASEQQAQYGILVGTRLMQKNNGDGFTIDAYVGYGIGYRSFDTEPIFENVFSSLNQSRLAQTFRFGVNFGYSFSFDGRR